MASQLADHQRIRSKPREENSIIVKTKQSNQTFTGNYNSAAKIERCFEMHQENSDLPLSASKSTTCNVDIKRHPTALSALLTRPLKQQTQQPFHHKQIIKTEPAKSHNVGGHQQTSRKNTPRKRKTADTNSQYSANTNSSQVIKDDTSWLDVYRTAPIAASSVVGTSHNSPRSFNIKSHQIAQFNNVLATLDQHFMSESNKLNNKSDDCSNIKLNNHSSRAKKKCCSTSCSTMNSQQSTADRDVPLKDYLIQAYLSNWLTTFRRIMSTGSNQQPEASITTAGIQTNKASDNPLSPLAVAAAAAVTFQYLVNSGTFVSTSATTCCDNMLFTQKDDGKRNDKCSAHASSTSPTTANSRSHSTFTVPNSFPSIQQMLSALELDEEKIYNETVNRKCDDGQSMTGSSNFHQCRQAINPDPCCCNPIINGNLPINGSRSLLQTASAEGYPLNTENGKCIIGRTSGLITSNSTTISSIPPSLADISPSLFKGEFDYDSGEAVDLSFRGRNSLRKRSRNDNSFENTCVENVLTSHVNEANTINNIVRGGNCTASRNTAPSYSIFQIKESDELSTDITDRFEQLLEQLLRNASYFLKTLQVSLQDQIDILKCCWHRLLVTFMIDLSDDRNLAVMSALRQFTNVNKQLHLQRRQQKREKAIDLLEKLILKGRNLNMSRRLVDNVRKMILIYEVKRISNYGHLLKESETGVEKSFQAEIDAMNNSKTHPNSEVLKSQRHGQFMMFLNRLFNMSANTLQPIYWGHGSLVNDKDDVKQNFNSFDDYIKYNLTNLEESIKKHGMTKM